MLKNAIQSNSLKMGTTFLFTLLLNIGLGLGWDDVVLSNMEKVWTQRPWEGPHIKLVPIKKESFACVICCFVKNTIYTTNFSYHDKMLTSNRLGEEQWNERKQTGVCLRGK